ncbi:MAG: hypothetical protein AB1817_18570, partial [Chloroflexota bacterium]
MQKISLTLLFSGWLIVALACTATPTETPTPTPKVAKAVTSPVPSNSPAPGSASPVPKTLPSATPAPKSSAPAVPPVKPIKMNSPEYGAQAFLWWRPEAADRDLGMMKDAGLTWVKQQFAWRDIEGAKKGAFSWENA